MAYTADYELGLLRGFEEPRPWDLSAQVMARLSPDATLLDVGCGTAIKLRPLVPQTSFTVGCEPNSNMLARAREHRAEWGAHNLYLTYGTAEALPFRDGVFSVATSMLAVHDAAELSRVLKVGGVAIVEKIGERDKLNLKEMFGSDELGPRGFLSGLNGGSRSELLRLEFEAAFSEVAITSGVWRTFYSLEGFAQLCEQVSLVRGFDRVRDARILSAIEERFSTPQGIVTEQHRLLIIARK